MKRVTALALWAAVSAAACAPPPDPAWTLDGEAFGTRWTVRIRGPEADAASVRAAIEAELDAVDRSMSNWRTDSELFPPERGPESTDPVSRSRTRWRWCWRPRSGSTQNPAAPSTSPSAPCSGSSASARTAIRERPRPLRKNSRLSAPGSAATCCPWSGWTPGAALRRRIPGVELDLSGIAKGYAVDRVSTILTELGFAEHLVEVGGEIRARGEWTVGVQDPSGGIATAVHRAFPVRDLGMATSGGYRDFRPAGGR